MAAQSVPVVCAWAAPKDTICKMASAAHAGLAAASVQVGLSVLLA